MSTAFPIVSWANGTNIYEVNIRQYTKEGTLQAFIGHIPRLYDMGVEILWLMPVTPISEENRQGTYGSYYAASSYTAIDPAYGTVDDFIALVQAAHSYNMKVIIDWVANHTGYDHVWTTRYPDWYRKNAEGKFIELYGWIDVIDLNYEIPAMRIEMIASMKYWVREFDIDGFRCDMARTVPIDFWIEARSECDALKCLFWLAECEVFSYHEVFDATYGWECMRAIDRYKKDEIPFSDVPPILSNYAQYPIGSRKLLFTSNHDENTYNGTEYEKYGMAAKALAVFTCTWPGIPLIYSGQEQPNYRRLAFFEKDAIDWQGAPQLHGFYKTLLQLRKKNKAIQESASVLLVTANHPEVLVYLCRRQADKVLVMMNLSMEPASFSINHPAIAGRYHDLFTGEAKEMERKAGYTFEPGQYVVYHATAQP